MSVSVSRQAYMFGIFQGKPTSEAIINAPKSYSLEFLDLNPVVGLHRYQIIILVFLRKQFTNEEFQTTVLISGYFICFN